MHRYSKLAYGDGVHLYDEPVAHRLAALSEGRAVFTPSAPESAAKKAGAKAGAGAGACATIRVQCAYHGWTFDGASVGRCRLTCFESA